MIRKKPHILVVVIACLISFGVAMWAVPVLADSGEFSLQVSPSPLVLTLKPGQKSTIEFTVRNTGLKLESLTVTPRSFKVNADESVSLSDTQTPEEASWLSFEKPTFSINPGQLVTERMTVSVPKEAGFSYAFALIIRRQQEPSIPEDAGRQIKGSVALFTLINIDRPGAVRKLDIDKFAVSQRIYEFLPATLNLTLKNTGNTIVQPFGNVFIQRGSQDQVPISTLPVNQASGYILPGTARTLTTQWSDGFQVLHATTDASGIAKQDLSWNWDNLSHIAIGRYTAKVVAIYNDGTRDVPVIGEVSFWVIPWRLLLGVLVVVLLIIIGLWSVFRKLFFSKTKRRRIRF